MHRSLRALTERGPTFFEDTNFPSDNSHTYTSAPEDMARAIIFQLHSIQQHAQQQVQGRVTVGTVLITLLCY